MLFVNPAAVPQLQILFHEGHLLSSYDVTRYMCKLKLKAPTPGELISKSFGLNDMKNTPRLVLANSEAIQKHVHKQINR